MLGRVVSIANSMLHADCHVSCRLHNSEETKLETAHEVVRNGKLHGTMRALCRPSKPPGFDRAPTNEEAGRPPDKRRDLSESV